MPERVGTRKQRRLSITPVPTPLWGENLRSPSALGPKEWRKLRASLLVAHSGKCESCGGRAKKWFGHEVWVYKTSTTPAIARLKRVAIHCVKCHACEHFTRTIKFATPSQVASAIKHYCRVNQVTQEVFRRDFTAATMRAASFSKLEWIVDYGPYSSLVAERLTHPKKKIRRRPPPLRC
jgi:hypothetical protein